MTAAGARRSAAGIGRELWRSVAGHPRLELAVKAALAAGLAWLCAKPIGGLAHAYPYYAPFGAVVGVTRTFASSLRGSVQVVAAIAVAAVTATIARTLPLPEVAGIAFVVAAGTVLGGHPRLGDMGSWVPVSGLFILIVGAGDPTGYVLAYLGLTALGAAVGVLLNGVFPPLRLTSTRLALRRLRSELAGQLRDLAEGLSEAEPPSGEDWERRRRRLRPHVEEMRSLVQEAAEARRGNWRAVRYQEATERQYEHARTLERLSGLVEQVVDLVVERECAELETVALGPDLRPVTAETLHGLARVLEARPEERRWQEAFTALVDRIDELQEAVRTAWSGPDQDAFTAAAIVVELERAAQSLRRTAHSYDADRAGQGDELSAAA